MDPMQSPKFKTFTNLLNKQSPQRLEDPTMLGYIPSIVFLSYNIIAKMFLPIPIP
jgi:hypothetical protein